MTDTLEKRDTPIRIFFLFLKKEKGKKRERYFVENKQTMNLFTFSVFLVFYTRQSKTYFFISGSTAHIIVKV